MAYRDIAVIDLKPVREKLSAAFPGMKTAAEHFDFGDKAAVGLMLPDGRRNAYRIENGDVDAAIAKLKAWAEEPA